MLFVLLLGTGAIALVAFNSGAGLFGGQDPQPTNEPDDLSQGDPEESTVSPSTGPSYEEQEDERIEEFARDYDEALRQEDWAETYTMLEDSSQQEFTEQEWAEIQQALLDADGLPAPLESVTVDQNEEETDSPARVTLYYEDGTEETIVAGIPMAVLDESESGVPKRFLTEDEISELEQIATEETTTEEESIEQQFISDYYEAVDNEDWVSTYSMLSEESQVEFTEEEWVQAQQTREASSPLPPIESATLNNVEGHGPGFTADVILTHNDGSETTVEGVAVLDKGEGLKRYLTEGEIEYLRGLIEETGTEEEAIEEAIRSHYEAIGENDFEEAYSYFGPTFRSTSSEESWVESEESQGITGSTINSVDVVSVDGDTAEASVDVSFEDNTGTSDFFLGWNLVKEDGQWKLDEISVGGGTN